MARLLRGQPAARALSALRRSEGALGESLKYASGGLLHQERPPFTSFSDESSMLLTRALMRRRRIRRPFR